MGGRGSGATFCLLAEVTPSQSPLLKVSMFLISSDTEEYTHVIKICMKSLPKWFFPSSAAHKHHLLFVVSCCFVEVPEFFISFWSVLIKTPHSH